MASYVFTCARCGAAATRSYQTSRRRRNGNEYCSKACQRDAKAAAAKARLEARFWSRVDVRGADECWHWNGRVGRHGYGAFDWRNRPHIASRFAYSIAVGDPGDMHVCHRCDNPSCVNPRHLWLGTHTDNMRDASAKGRMSTAGVKGEQHPRAKLTEKDVAAIRASTLPATHLGRMYGVSGTQVRNVQTMKHWRGSP